MDAVLLDTDVFSYLLKQGDPWAESYVRHVKDKTIAVSFVRDQVSVETRNPRENLAKQAYCL